MCTFTEWILRNRAQRTLACIVTEDGVGLLTVVIELEGEVILREPHYSQARAEERAARLRAVFSDWVDSR